jgi:hypothetical protein
MKQFIVAMLLLFIAGIFITHMVVNYLLEPGPVIAQPESRWSKPFHRHVDSSVQSIRIIPDDFKAMWEWSMIFENHTDTVRVYFIHIIGGDSTKVNIPPRPSGGAFIYESEGRGPAIPGLGIRVINPAVGGADYDIYGGTN